MNGDDDDDRGNVPRRNLPSRHVRSEQSTSNHPTVLVSTNFQYIEYVAFYSEPVKRTFVRPNDVEKKSFFFSMFDKNVPASSSILSEFQHFCVEYACLQGQAQDHPYYRPSSSLSMSLFGFSS